MIVIEKASVLLHRNTADQGTYLEVILLLVLESRVTIHVGNVKIGKQTFAFHGKMYYLCFSRKGCITARVVMHFLYTCI